MSDIENLKSQVFEKWFQSDILDTPTSAVSHPPCLPHVFSWCLSVPGSIESTEVDQTESDPCGIHRLRKEIKTTNNEWYLHLVEKKQKSRVP